MDSFKLPSIVFLMDEHKNLGIFFDGIFNDVNMKGHDIVPKAREVRKS